MIEGGGGLGLLCGGLPSLALGTRGPFSGPSRRTRHLASGPSSGPEVWLRNVASRTATLGPFSTNMSSFGAVLSFPQHVFVR